MTRHTTTFAAQVLAARTARGLSREQVARHIGVAANALRAWEMRNEPPPSDPAVLAKLADMLRLPRADVVRAAVAGRAFIRVECDAAPSKALAVALTLALQDDVDHARLAACIEEVTP